MTDFRELILSAVLIIVGAVLSGAVLKKINGRKKIILLPVIALAVFTAVAFIFLYEKPNLSSPLNESCAVIDYGCEYSAVSLEISDAEFSGISPYIGIKIKNDGDTDCIYGENYDIKKKKDNGEYVSSIGNFMSDSVAFILKGHSEQERKYYIDSDVIPENGIYRFELPFYVRSVNGKNEAYTAFIEFSAESAVRSRTDLQFSMEKVIYENGSFSAETKADALPDIRISPEMSLFIRDNEEWREIGVLNEIALSKDNFDKRIWHSDVTDQISAVDVRADNKRAWQVYEKNEDTKNSRVFVLLRQDDGSLYFCCGEYNVSGLTEPNSDSSYFRWICSVSEKE